MITLFAFILLGLIWGSFSNALIYRLPNRIPLTNPKRSQCPSCKTDIGWFDNIPVLSWLVLNGKCRICKSKISIQYPMVEVLNAVSAYFCLEHFVHIPTALLSYFLLSTLIVITFIDLQHMIIPDKINKPGMIFGLFIGCLNEYSQVFLFPYSQTALESIAGLIFGYGLLFSVAWGYEKLSGVSGLGGGDIKLMGFMGALLGPASIPSILISGSFIGVFAGIIVILAKKYSLRTEMPFGPSLAIGIILYIFGFDAIELMNALTAKFLLPQLMHG